MGVAENSPLHSRPVIDDVMYWHMDAFFLLDSSRQTVQNAIGRIPLSEMISYAKEFGSITNVQDFCKIMTNLDNDYINYLESKRPKQPKQAVKKGLNNNRGRS